MSNGDEDVRGTRNRGLDGRLVLPKARLRYRAAKPRLHAGRLRLDRSLSSPQRTPTTAAGIVASAAPSPPLGAEVTPANRGLAPHNRRDPADIFMQLDREQAHRFGANVPFGNPARNRFHIGVGATAIAGVALMYGGLLPDTLAAAGASGTTTTTAELEAAQPLRTPLAKITPDWGSLSDNWYRGWHLLRHAQGLAPVGASYFFRNTNLLDLLQQAEEALPFLQPTGNIMRIVESARQIGVDATTGQPSALYTVITDSLNRLVTMFPGLPNRPPW